jgi:hypothetical protein
VREDTAEGAAEGSDEDTPKDTTEGTAPPRPSSRSSNLGTIPSPAASVLSRVRSRSPSLQVSGYRLTETYADSHFQLSERPATRPRLEPPSVLPRQSLSPSSFYSPPPARPRRTSPAPFPVSPLLSLSAPSLPSRHTSAQTGHSNTLRCMTRAQAPPDDLETALTFFDDWRANAIDAIAAAATSISVYDDGFRAKVVAKTAKEGGSVLLDMIDVLANADGIEWKPPRHSPTCAIPPHLSAFFHPVAFNSFYMCVPTCFYHFFHLTLTSADLHPAQARSETFTHLLSRALSSKTCFGVSTRLRTASSRTISPLTSSIAQDAGSRLGHRLPYSSYGFLFHLPKCQNGLYMLSSTHRLPLHSL